MIDLQLKQYCIIWVLYSYFPSWQLFRPNWKCFFPSLWFCGVIPCATKRRRLFLFPILIVRYTHTECSHRKRIHSQGRLQHNLTGAIPPTLCASCWLQDTSPYSCRLLRLPSRVRSSLPTGEGWATTEWWSPSRPQGRPEAGIAAHRPSGYSLHSKRNRLPEMMPLARKRRREILHRPNLTSRRSLSSRCWCHRRRPKCKRALLWCSGSLNMTG